MIMMLGITEKDLKNKSAYWTAREIEQQPDVWQKVAKEIAEKREELDAWFAYTLTDQFVRIILTGAGTSAYVGETLAPFLSQKLSRPVEAVSTTNIVAAPEQYLFKKVPTLIISFARSGNSPESVAACELCDQLLDKAYHLIITCNDEGALAKMKKDDHNRYVVIMPEETNDKSFAMTSSFSSMLLAAVLIFQLNNKMLAASINISKKILTSEVLENINTLSRQSFKRVVCLGTGGLLGIAREAALKILELSNGQLDCYFESPLGFRHGPKLVVDENTLVVLLGSNNAYSKQYDHDLLSEIKRDNKAANIINLSDFLDCTSFDIDDLWLAFPYILYCQVFAFYQSLVLKITPDNPCPTGEANRVVQGVEIYPYEGG